MAILIHRKFKVLLMAFLLALQVNAHAGVEMETSHIEAAIQQDKSSMVWPMMPNENIHELARLFYPKNEYMQRLFIQKTLRLNTQARPGLSAEDRFPTLTPIQIPTLKSLAVTRPIHAHKKTVKQGLKMSISIQSMQIKAVNGLLQQYQNLLSRNTFLRDELAKLNQKLSQLQQKMLDLKRLFSMTSTSEPAKPLKLENLDKAATGKTKSTAKPMMADDSLQGYMRQPWLLALLIFSLLALAMTVILKRRRQQMEHSFLLTEISQAETGNIDTREAWVDIQQDAGHVSAQDTGVLVQEMEQDSEEYAIEILEEARLLTSVNRYDDAIAHLKDNIKASPKATIQPWLYLLDIFKQLGMQAEFETYALMLHQTFNVMTPLWHVRDVALVVPESLEEFPHIMEKLYGLWPSDSARSYLRDLINDNRGGERGGFGRAVLDEILMLIALLDRRKKLDAISASG
ncbi:MAG TPA: hypothetical protein PLR90_00140 [Methylophilus sp.]|nr:hypothetical protein [Methylophilus sp.]HQQ32297.1 hypothetical protein [Methylophilus sp.]